MTNEPPFVCDQLSFWAQSGWRQENINRHKGEGVGLRSVERIVFVFKECHLPSKYLPLPLPESPESVKELIDSIRSWSTSSLESQLVSSEGEV